MLEEAQDPEKDKLMIKWFQEGNYNAMIRHLAQGLQDSENRMNHLMKELEKGDPNNLYKYTDSITEKLLKSSVFTEDEKRLIFTLLGCYIGKRILEVTENLAQNEA